MNHHLRCMREASKDDDKDINQQSLAWHSSALSFFRR